jgi:hypothetical protein
MLHKVVGGTTNHVDLLAWSWRFSEAADQGYHPVRYVHSSYQGWLTECLLSAHQWNLVTSANQQFYISFSCLLVTYYNRRTYHEPILHPGTSSQKAHFCTIKLEAIKIYLRSSPTSSHDLEIEVNICCRNLQLRHFLMHRKKWKHANLWFIWLFTLLTSLSINVSLTWNRSRSNLHKSAELSYL